MKLLPQRRLRVVKRMGQQGVTLVEVLLTMGLLSIFMTVIATVFTSAADMQAQTDSYSAVSSEGRFVMARLNMDIAQATSISTPGTLGSSSANLVMVVGGSTYTYSLNGTRLQLNNSTATDFITGDGVTVSGVSFQRLGNAGGKESIRYSFTLTAVSQTRGGPETQTFTSTVGRR